jgi:hypothetical protein
VLALVVFSPATDMHKERAALELILQTDQEIPCGFQFMRDREDSDQMSGRMRKAPEMLGQQRTMLAIVIIEEPGMCDHQQRHPGKRHVDVRKQERFVACLMIGVIEDRLTGEAQRGA